MIPAEELWEQYDKGLLTESKVVGESIHNYRNNRALLEAKEDDDLSDSTINAIYASMSREANAKKNVSKLILPSYLR